MGQLLQLVGSEARPASNRPGQRHALSLSALASRIGAALRALRQSPPDPPKLIAERRVPVATIGRGAKDKTHRKGVSRIVVTAEEELFERIRARAVGKRVSFAAEVRHLLECGLAATDHRP